MLKKYKLHYEVQLARTGTELNNSSYIGFFSAICKIEKTRTYYNMQQVLRNCKFCRARVGYRFTQPSISRARFVWLFLRPKLEKANGSLQGKDCTHELSAIQTTNFSQTQSASIRNAMNEILASLKTNTTARNWFVYVANLLFLWPSIKQIQL